MNTKRLQKGLGVCLAASLAGVWGSAHAAEYWLWAGKTTVTMPGTGEQIVMWGFAKDATNNFADGLQGAITVPGPALTVPPGDSNLTIHLYNDALPEPVSIVVPGQIAAMMPVKFTDGQNRQRVRSFTAEAAPNSVQTYEWSNLKPGTYLYQSGTHPAKQVQMGLYGAMTKNQVAGQIYSGVNYDREFMLLYSEIDPAMHAAVATGAYGTPAYPSAFEYAPRYFLVNGKPHQAGDAPLVTTSLGQKTLFRFLNAGLKSHAMEIDGLDMRLVAEDGKPYPYPRNSYMAFLPAGKTMDAIMTLVPGQEGTYPIYDRMMALTNGGLPNQQADSGLITVLSVGALTAMDDVYTVAEDTTLAVAAPGVLANDLGATNASVVTGVSNGILNLAADGSFTYTPNLNFYGTDAFTYMGANPPNLGNTASNIANVTIHVTPVNDAPVAVNDVYTMIEGSTLTIPASIGVLSNDTDPDANPLTAVLVSGTTSGTVTLNPDGSFSYSPLSGTVGDMFTYQASDGALNSNTATVTINVVSNVAIAVDDVAMTTMNTPVTFNVVNNDYSLYGTIDPATVTIVTPPNMGGTVTVNPNGTVTYTPRLNFKGTDVFSYTVRNTLGRLSNTAIVRVNVVR